MLGFVTLSLSRLPRSLRLVLNSRSSSSTRTPFRPGFNMNLNSVNFLSGNPLNRASWLRSSPVFLNGVVDHPKTKWMVFNKAGEPFVVAPSGQIAWVSKLDLEGSLFGNGNGNEKKKKLFGHVEGFEKQVQDKRTGQDSWPDKATARLEKPNIVFLGVLEVDGQGEELELEGSDGVRGVPHFAVELTIEADSSEATLSSSLPDALKGKGEFVNGRMAASKMSREEAAIFSEGRSMLDWNTRNKFCAGCGSKSYSVWGGWKLACSSFLPGAVKPDEPCPTERGLHNFAHPRTDSVVITAVIDETGDKVLLGKNRKFPGNFYSTLAGFIEPAETFEEAVAREIYEESGVRVTNVTYHSAQPWPYPANLMVGFYARADSSQPIRIDLDSELADCRWFTREEVLAVLRHPTGTLLRGRDMRTLEKMVTGDTTTAQKTQQPQQNVKGIESSSDGDVSQARAVAENDTMSTTKNTTADEEEPPFRIPPREAIAGVLISEWAYGKARL